MAIKFLKLKDPCGCFSNFWRCEVEGHGKTWPTSEHYYQAMKYHEKDEIFVELIRKATSAWDAAALGRRGRNIRDNWEDIRVEVMEDVVLKKFQQHDDLREILISTGEEEIIEDFKGCSFWGIGDGSGENAMGKVLMRVRSLIQEP